MAGSGGWQSCCPGSALAPGCLWAVHPRGAQPRETPCWCRSRHHGSHHLSRCRRRAQVPCRHFPRWRRCQTRMRSRCCRPVCGSIIRSPRRLYGYVELGALAIASHTFQSGRSGSLFDLKTEGTVDDVLLCAALGRARAYAATLVHLCLPADRSADRGGGQARSQLRSGDVPHRHADECALWLRLLPPDLSVRCVQEPAL